jgi:exodeoxyribonuclease III
MKLLTWNVNGIRACQKSGFQKWFEDEKADIVCLQEVKAQPHQVGPELLNPLKYNSYWHCASKPGYSGLVTYSKREPESVREGIGDAAIDSEGRVLTLDFGKFVVVNRREQLLSQFTQGSFQTFIQVGI